MSQPKKEAESPRHRMPTQADIPAKRAVDLMLAECQNSPGLLVELPIELAGAAEPFCLTVELEPTGNRPVWTLYVGAGSQSRSVWTYMIKDTDMISEVLSLSLDSGAPPMPPAEGAPAAQPVPASTRSEQAGLDRSWDTPGDASASFVAGIDLSPGRSAYQSPAESAPAAGSGDGPNILLGHILVDSGMIPEPVLDAALTLQEMVRQKTLTPDEATEALRKVHSRGSDLRDVVAEIKHERQQKPPADAMQLLREAGLVSEQDILKARQVVEQLRKAGLDSPHAIDNAKTLLDLLRLAGFISDEDIRRAATTITSRPTDICKALLNAGTIDSLAFDVASRFVKHVRLGTFKQEQAIIALHYSQRCRTDFEETVHSLGWQVPIES